MGVIVVLLLGAVSFGRIKIDLFPRFNFPAAGVVTEYPGAAPSEVESLVTRTVEEVMGQVARVSSIRSVSLEERSVVVVEFEWGTDMDYATLQMREKLDLASSFFPAEAKRPVVAAFDPSSLPVMFVAITGGEANAEEEPGADPLVTLTRLGTDTVKRRLERVEGVASVSVIGGTDEEVLIAVDRDRLAAAGVSWFQLTQAVAGASLNLPGGEINESGQDFLVRSLGEIDDISTLEELTIGARSVTVPAPLGPRTVTAAVLLRDVARISVLPRDPEDLSRLGGERSVILAVQKASDANTVAVSRGVREEIEGLEGDLPAGTRVEITMDQADFIGKAVGFIGDNALQGALLAVLVLLLFLREIRSVIVIGLAIPVSVVSTFVLMFFSDMTLNLMTVGGLALGVGMLVDNSIVVLENIFRHMEDGEEAVKAAVSGTAEVVTAVSASTLTTIVVFLPVVFVGGVAGTLFKELSITVTFSLLSSLAVAVTFVPMAAATLFSLGRLRSRRAERAGLGVYARLVRGALRLRLLVVLAALGALALALPLVPDIGAEFVPSMDRGEIAVSVTLPAGTDLDTTDKTVARVEAIVSEVPEARFVTATVGSSGGLRLDVAGVLGGGSNIGSVGLKLIDREDRDRSAEEVARALKDRLFMVQTADVTVESLGSFMSMAGIRPIEIVISGDDPTVLADLAARVHSIVSGTDGTVNVDRGDIEARPELHIRYDRSKLAALGLHPALVATSVRSAIEGQMVGTMRHGDQSLDVILRYAETYRRGLADIEGFVVASPGGQAIPLSQVAEVTRAEGPSVIQREGGRRIQVVSAGVEDRDLASVTADIREDLEGMSFPEGYGYEIEGEHREMEEAFSGLSFALLLSVVLVYMVMASQFESLIQPFVIMLTIPLAVVGVLVALRLTGLTLSVPSFIGIIMLAGIVVNNAIVLLDFVGQLRGKGLARNEAVLTAARYRLRPILMTTTTTVLGLGPMAFATLEGSELARSLSVTVIGGLTSSTLLTLVVIPVVYTLVDDAVVFLTSALTGRGLRPGLPAAPRSAPPPGANLLS